MKIPNLTSSNTYDWVDDKYIQVADNSWLVQSVEQCPVLPEIVEGEVEGGEGECEIGEGECEIVEGEPKKLSCLKSLKVASLCSRQILWTVYPISWIISVPFVDSLHPLLKF